jgi:hypothetical protein
VFIIRVASGVGLAVFLSHPPAKTTSQNPEATHMQAFTIAIELEEQAPSNLVAGTFCNPIS